MLRKLFYPLILLLFPLFATTALCLGSTDKPPPKQGGSSEINCFIYHRFGNEDQYPSTSIATKLFAKHLQYLSENDYTVLTLGDALKRLFSGGQVPEKTAVLSIDDAYKSVFNQAVPLLDEYGYKATIFVPTQYVGSKNYMSWEDIQSLQERGFEFGNHSHSHAHFVNNADIQARFERDLSKAQAMFEQHLNNAPELYAYPFGEYTPKMSKILEKHGYLAAAAQKSGVFYREGNRYVIPRFPMNEHYGQMEKFREKLRMHPLRVASTDPESPLVSDKNPPGLLLRVENKEVNPQNLQCFISGEKKPALDWNRDKGTINIRVQPREELQSRRTLYTITAPSENAQKWFWYSFVWINPQIRE